MTTTVQLPESRRAAPTRPVAQGPPDDERLPPFGRIKGAKRSGDIVLDRAEFEIDWYDKRATRSRIAYCSIKLMQVLLAAFVPVAAGFSAPKLVTGSLGGMIVVLEGVQQLFRFHDNWVRYRQTCEGMTREKYLYAAGAGDYAKDPRPRRLLAERIESLASREAHQWVNMQKTDDGDPADGDPADPQVTTHTVAQHTVSKQVISEQVTSAQVTSAQISAEPEPSVPQQVVLPGAMKPQ
ncbi:MAG: hypothetical protein QOH29_2653 [Actinomycetota bacterium]|jgi:hypothetical protein|nr:hypothetical protein [Actinomycetota bacterium]